MSAFPCGALAFHIEKTMIQKDICLFTGSVLKTNGANLNLYLLSPSRADRGRTNLANLKTSEYEIHNIILLEATWIWRLLVIQHYQNRNLTDTAIGIRSKVLL